MVLSGTQMHSLNKTIGVLFSVADDERRTKQQRDQAFTTAHELRGICVTNIQPSDIALLSSVMIAYRISHEGEVS